MNNGTKICFDFNVRIKNWKSKKIAQQTMIKFSNIADIIFMTKEDINNLGLKNYKTIINRNYENKIIGKSRKRFVRCFIGQFLLT